MEFSRNEIEFSLTERTRSIEKLAYLLVSHLDTYKTDIDSLCEKVERIKALRHEYDLLVTTYSNGINRVGYNEEFINLLHEIDSEHDKKMNAILNKTH